MRIKDTFTDRVFVVIAYAVVILCVLIALYPLWLVVIYSISDPQYVNTGSIWLLPKGISFEGYKEVLSKPALLRGYWNTITQTLVGTALNMVLTIPAAYALSKKNLPGRGFFMTMILITMFFSGGLIPIFINIKDLGLYDTRMVMILMNLVSVWNLMVARTYIQTTIPEELYEAAVMDGAGHFTYFFRCVLPLSGTIVAVLSVYYGVARWNDYFTGLVMLRSRKLFPLQLILKEILASLTTGNSDTFFASYADNLGGLQEALRKAEVAKYCCIVVATVPAVLLYIFMQKYFVKGVMIGSLKG